MSIFKKGILSICMSLCGIYFVSAQYEMSMPALTWVPQATYTDITAQHKQYKTSISIPVIGSLQLNYFNSAFTFNQLVQNNTIDPNRVIPKLKKYNQLYTGGSIDLFALRMHVKNSVVQITLRDVWTQRFVYTKDLATLIWNGNASFAGGSAQLNNVRLAANYYRELGLGYTKNVSDKFTIGIRGKFLTGLTNISTTTSKNSLYTDPNGLYLNGHSKTTVLTSGLINAEQINVSNILGLNNLGAGVDLGVRYAVTDKLTLSGNLNNVGFIHWKQDVKNYRVDGAYNYSGIVFKDSTSIVNAGWENIGDSLEQSFKPRQDTKAYNGWLTPSIYLNANYSIKENLNVYAAVAMDFYHAVRGALTLGATQHVGKTLQATLNYTITPTNYFNVGAGIALRGGPIQMYLASDNVVAFFDPYAVRYMNIRVGMNLIFGKFEKETK